MFGDWGALILQFSITVVVVFGLIAVVYWLVRRYSAGGLGRIGRGRVPRLAIVDAMSVDGRRRLVLVRRDNVEHLILIGGPSDLVVEPTIQRSRRPKPVATAEAEALSAGPSEPEHPAESPPIPFPQPRNASPMGANGVHVQDRPVPTGRAATSEPSQSATQPARIRMETAALPSPARFVDLDRPTRIESAPPAQVPETKSESPAPDEPPAFIVQAETENPSPAPVPRSPYARPEKSNGDSTSSANDLSPYARPRVNGDDDTGGQISDLEREMARLLGEITQKHPS